MAALNAVVAVLVFLLLVGVVVVSWFRYQEMKQMKLTKKGKRNVRK